MFTFKGPQKHFYRHPRHAKARAFRLRITQAERNRVHAISQDDEMERVKQCSTLTLTSFQLIENILINSHIVCDKILQNDGDKRCSIQRYHDGHNVVYVKGNGDTLAMVCLTKRRVFTYNCTSSMETQIAAIRTVYNIGSMATTPVHLVGNDEGELSLGAIAYTITQDRDWPKRAERDPG